MYKQQTPFSYFMVAYCELAKGHDLRLHKPVKLYQFLQKFCDSVFIRKEQCLCAITFQTTQSMIISTVQPIDYIYYIRFFGNIFNNYKNLSIIDNYRIKTMIENILILLVANTVIPMLPLPPQVLVPISIAHSLYANQPTVYQHMNLTRIHNPELLKKSFHKSMKTLHPDRGGDPQTFNQVKNLQKIMQTNPHYYDTLNITSADLQFGVKPHQAASIKQMSYYVETGIYYFIVLLFALSFTIDDQLRPARKFLLPMIIIFGGYEIFMHLHPEVVTIIDLLHNKLPIFVQKIAMKRMLAVFVAIVRTRFSRSLTAQKKLLKKLDEDQDQAEYKVILLDLLAIYKQRAEDKQKRQKSWGAKIRKLISAGFTILVIYSIASGFFSGSSSQEL